MFARDAPVAVVFCRKNKREVAVFRWNLETDEFTLGQWLKALIYPHECGISPDGERLLVRIYKYREPAHHYTVLSKNPYLKALRMWEHEDCTNPKLTPEDFFAFLGYELPGGPFPYGIAKLLAVSVRPRETWVVVRPHFQSTEIPTQTGWTYDRISELDLATLASKDCDFLTSPNGEKIPVPRYEWTLLCDHRLLWGDQGCIYAADLTDTGMGEARLLHDFNGLEFEEVVAPY